MFHATQSTVPVPVYMHVCIDVCMYRYMYRTLKSLNNWPEAPRKKERKKDEL